MEDMMDPLQEEGMKAQAQAQEQWHGHMVVTYYIPYTAY
jgi:hypothetical protein